MKAIVFAAAIAAIAAAPALAQPYTPMGKAAPVCIRPFDTPTGSLVKTKVVNPQTILFYMQDGKIWKNTLKGPCRGLMFHGFNFLTHQDEVCSNAQPIQVIETGEICQLGAFVPYTPPPQAPATANP